MLFDITDLQCFSRKTSPEEFMMNKLSILSYFSKKLIEKLEVNRQPRKNFSMERNTLRAFSSQRGKRKIKVNKNVIGNFLYFFKQRICSFNFNLPVCSLLQ